MKANLVGLLHEHDEISRMGWALLDLVGRDGGTPHEAQDRLGALAQAIAAHVAHEDGVLYPEIEHHPSADLSDAAQSFAAEFEALRADWCDYLRAWPRARADADWEGFRAATGAIIPKMIDRIARENDCLYPLALRRGALTLR